MRLIDAHELIKNKFKNPISYAAFCNLVGRQPTVDAVPVRHGRWKRNKNGTYSCSKCQSWIPNGQKHYANFCLYCGARMDGKDGEGNG